MSGDRWFRRLLRLLPFDMRSDYGADMEQVFRDERRAAASDGRGGTLRVWSRAIAGLLAVGPREHLVQLRQDIRYTIRSMLRQPGFVAISLLTLALGIGANTAIFNLVRAVLLKPLPYHEPERLVAVWNRWDGTDAARLSNPEFLDYAEKSRTLTLAGSSSTAVNISSDGGEPERVSAGLITPDALDVIGVAPALGRPFRDADAQPDQPTVTILSDGFWRRHFGSDPSIIGRRIVVNGLPTEVVGVMPPDFMLPIEITTATRAELYAPLYLDAGAPRNRRGGHYLVAFGRLSAGTSIETAASEMDGIVARLTRQYPDEHDQGNFRIVLRPLRDDLLGDSRQVLAILSAAVALVLLLACANVANLMLARGEARRREIVVRTALGASRFRIIRQLLTESCLLALAGSAVGLIVAHWCQRAVLAFGADALPRIHGLELDRTVLLFAATLALATGVVFGSIPAFQLSRSRVTETLKEAGRGLAGGRAGMRRALVICQVSIALVLMVAAGLLIKSYANVTSVPSGVNPDGVLTMRITLPAARYPDRPEVSAFFNRLVDRVSNLPGVQAAGAGSGLPLAVASGDWSFDIAGRPRIGTRYPGAADWYVVTHGYFEALRIPLKRGRLPLASDDAGGRPVIFINESMARALFAGEDPIGRRIRLSRSTGAEQPWRTIAGIVADVRYRGLETPPLPEMYIPHDQFVHFFAGVQARARSLVVRTTREPMALANAVRAALRAIDPQVPAAQVRDMESVVSESVSERRLNVFLIASFGVVSLALAAIGLYGVMAFSVAQRTREFGLRLAIGASRSAVLSLVLKEGVGLVVAGAAIGSMGALIFGGSLAALLFGISPRDMGVLAGVVALLIVIGAVASLVPAHRATRVDPLVALRAD